MFSDKDLVLIYLLRKGCGEVNDDTSINLIWLCKGNSESFNNETVLCLGRILTLRHSILIPDGSFAPLASQLGTYIKCLSLQCSVLLRPGLPNLVWSITVAVHLSVE